MSVGNAGSVKGNREAEGRSGQEKSTPHRKLTTSHLHQITVLRAMAKREAASSDLTPLQIGEITQMSGLNDEKEVQRYLFILEGQKLVTPHPEGDFTSRIWKITRDGVRALRTIEKSGEDS